MKRRALLGALAAAAVGCHRSAQPSAAASRIVSLAPGITDALFEIGAGSQVVARSDYCDYPPEVTKLPRVGTSLTPSYEAITRLSPTLIVGEAGANARRHELEALGPTLLLPWLSLEEIVASLRELGRRTRTIPAADALATRLHERLAVPAPANGPRVLLVIGYQPGKLDEIWFIRENSLHGALLHAAGARNAVPDVVSGLPRLSLERLIALDPDAIFILTQPGRASGDYLAPFRALTPLRAAREGHVEVIEAPEAYVHGPRILALVERLHAAVEKLGRGP
ncbi:MAG TPA: helical backbone metal receptor [Polyangiaceae bacterium]|nr:helical backbone metal receptor [Polyangiaceae bacterium]